MRYHQKDYPELLDQVSLERLGPSDVILLPSIRKDIFDLLDDCLASNALFGDGVFLDPFSETKKDINISKEDINKFFINVIKEREFIGNFYILFKNGFIYNSFRDETFCACLFEGRFSRMQKLHSDAIFDAHIANKGLGFGREGQEYATELREVLARFR